MAASLELLRWSQSVGYCAHSCWHLRPDGCGYRRVHENQSRGDEPQATEFISISNY